MAIKRSDPELLTELGFAAPEPEPSPSDGYDPSLDRRAENKRLYGDPHNSGLGTLVRYTPEAPSNVPLIPEYMPPLGAGFVQTLKIMYDMQRTQLERGRPYTKSELETFKLDLMNQFEKVIFELNIEILAAVGMAGRVPEQPVFTLRRVEAPHDVEVVPQRPDRGGILGTVSVKTSVDVH